MPNLSLLDMTEKPLHPPSRAPGGKKRYHSDDSDYSAALYSACSSPRSSMIVDTPASPDGNPDGNASKRRKRNPTRRPPSPASSLLALSIATFHDTHSPDDKLIAELLRCQKRHIHDSATKRSKFKAKHRTFLPPLTEVESNPDLMKL